MPARFTGDLRRGIARICEVKGVRVLLFVENVYLFARLKLRRKLFELLPQRNRCQLCIYLLSFFILIQHSNIGRVVLAPVQQSAPVPDAVDLCIRFGQFPDRTGMRVQPFAVP